MKSVSVELRYPGRTVEEVRAMLADTEFRQAVCTYQQVEDSAVSIEEYDDGSMTVALERTYGTSLVAFDSQGLEIPVALAFRKVGNNSWEVYHGINGADPALSTPFTVNFLADGSLDTATSTIPQIALTSANGTFNVDLDFNNITRF